MASNPPPAARKMSPQAQEVMGFLRGKLREFGITLFEPPGKDGDRYYLAVAPVVPKRNLQELNQLLTDLVKVLSDANYQVGSVVCRFDAANMYPGHLTVNDIVVIMICPTIETVTRQRAQGHHIPSVNLSFDEYPNLRNIAA